MLYRISLPCNKSLHWLSFFIGSFLFLACKKEGPIGPTGADGNANVQSGTVSLTSADWKWAGAWALQTGGGTKTIYSTRYADINSELITQDIVDKGSVQVFFKPDADEWVPLPFFFIDVTRNFSFNFVYDYTQGKIRLHYFWAPNGTTGSIPSGLNTHILPNYSFKYVITAAK